MKQFKQNIRYGANTKDHKNRVIDCINTLPVNEDQEYEIIIKPYKDSKTLRQLGYYFSAVVPATMEFQGLIKDDADMWLRNKMVKPRHIEILGEAFEIRPSISKMKINEMAAYIDDSINFLGTHGVYVPPPIYKDYKE